MTVLIERFTTKEHYDARLLMTRDLLSGEARFRYELTTPHGDETYRTHWFQDKDLAGAEADRWLGERILNNRSGSK